MESVFHIADRYAGYFFSGFLCLILLLTLSPFTFFPENEAVFLPAGGVHLAPPSIIYSEDFPAAAGHIKRFTILIRYSPGIAVPIGGTTLLSNAANSGEHNFSLIQYGTALIFRMNGRTAAERHGLIVDNAVRRGETMWCGIEYDGDVLRAYIDGDKRAERKIGRIDLSGWKASYPLVLGSEPNGYAGWTGTMYALAFFDETLPPFSFRDPELLLRVHPPALLFRFQTAGRDRIISTGRDSTTTLQIPHPYVPARRTILFENPRNIFKEHILVRDVVANILFFMPLGYFFGALIDRKRRGVLRTALQAVAVGLTISLAIELLQAYLPGRYSSIVDVVSNTTGALFGVFLFYSRLWFSELFREQQPPQPVVFPDE